MPREDKADSPYKKLNSRRTAVSYTHLDVYKRQIWNRAHSCFDTEIAADTGFAFDFHFSNCALSLSFVNISCLISRILTV